MIIAAINTESFALGFIAGCMVAVICLLGIVAYGGYKQSMRELDENGFSN